jgi:hypothetical protein
MRVRGQNELLEARGQLLAAINATKEGLLAIRFDLRPMIAVSGVLS